MTEAEWLACGEPTPMLTYLGWRASRRKRRVFACECCWRIRHLFRDDACRDALNAATQFADGLIDREELRSRRVEHREPANHAHPPTQVVAAAAQEGDINVVAVAGYAAEAVADTEAGAGSWAAVWAEEHNAQSVILRDIFGNPFRPVVFSPSWRTDTATTLARQMYESRDFSAMPILADALQDAGWDSDDVLNHCRGEGPHVRGCWVVDLVLGKE